MIYWHKQRTSCVSIFSYPGVFSVNCEMRVSVDGLNQAQGLMASTHFWYRLYHVRCLICFSSWLWNLTISLVQIELVPPLHWLLAGIIVNWLSSKDNDVIYDQKYLWSIKKNGVHNHVTYRDFQTNKNIKLGFEFFIHTKDQFVRRKRFFNTWSASNCWKWVPSKLKSLLLERVKYAANIIH